MLNFKVLFFLIFISITIQAQTCCSGGIPLSNGIGLSNETKGVLQIKLDYDYNNLNTLNSGNTRLDDNSRLRITHSALLNLSYNITNRFAIEGLFTWLNQRRFITNLGTEDLTTTSGFGDAALLAKYTLPNLLGDNSSISLGLGLRLPIGSTTNTNGQGIILAADLQPGSGALDYIFWLSASKNTNFRPSLTLFSRVIYRLTGTNSEYLETFSYTFGPNFQAYLGASDQLRIGKQLIDINLSFKYRQASQDRIDNIVQQSTGGNWIFVIPGITVPIANNTKLSLNTELPLYSFVKGTQLTPTYRITFGISTKLNLNKKTTLNSIIN